MLDPNAILIECRVEYAVGSAIILLRFFARWKIAGWRGFYWDDFFAFSSWVFFTMIYAMVEFLSKLAIPLNVFMDKYRTYPPRCNWSSDSNDAGAARSTSACNAKVHARRCKGDVCLFLLSNLPRLESEGLHHHSISPFHVSSTA